MHKRLKLLGILFSVFLLWPFTGSSFGVLTHEAIIDASWDHAIIPALMHRFPKATAAEIKEAHAYAYGGAVTPDMGYYPFSSTEFTNLVHYVRSGDMVAALLKDAETLNQYAFALGFLSHYNADNYGHPMATNRSVPLVYPKMEHKYGDVVTYAENKISHMRMEFGFDVLEIAKGNYASQSYHDFIGFKVDTAVLAKAFLETYGLNIDKVFHHHFSLAVETFRWLVANVFPSITKVAWASRKNSILKQHPTATSKQFRYYMKRREYNKQFGNAYKRPGFLSTSVSFIIKFMPKVGPLRALKFKPPTTKAEKYFEQSFDTIIMRYASNLNEIGAIKHDEVILKDKDFDTGNLTAHCEYSLADETYASWLMSLDKNHFENTDAAMRNNILHYYGADFGKGGRISKKCRRFFNSLHDLDKLHVN